MTAGFYSVNGIDRFFGFSIGYIPTRRAYDEGGHEPEASLFAPGCGEQIADQAIDLLAQLHGKEEGTQWQIKFELA